MSIETEKAHAFVQHLYSNPSLQHYTPLQREEQIAQFLDQNSATLMPTLSSSKFFPGYSWDRIARLILDLVQDKTDKLFLVDIREILSHRINFNFLREYNISTINYDHIQKQLLTIIEETMRYKRARQSLSGSYAAVLYDVFVRYLQASFGRKRYVHFEVTKVQKLQLPLEHLCNMLKVILLLMPVVWMFVEREMPTSSAYINFANLPNDVMGRAVDYLTQEVSLIPQSILKSAVYANVSFVDNKDLDATSRMAAIFSARCRNYHPSLKVDRGAESADKSWLYIAKRNYKFYGFDSKMLEEFYSIASDERW